MIYRPILSDEEKALLSLEKELNLVYGWLEAAEHRLHLTAVGVCMLAFLAGFCICWLAFVR